MGQPTSRTPVASRLVDVAAAALGAIVAGGLVLFATARYGPGISPDSAAYLSIAENVTAGRGLVAYTGRAIGDFPPGLPAMLAAVSWVSGWGAPTAARVVNALALGAIVLEAAVLLRRHVASPVLRVVGIAAATVAPPLVYVALWAWSETLFAALALGAIICIEFAAERPASRGWVVAAALLAAAAFTTRYVGAAVGLTGAILLAWRGRPMALRARAVRVALFGAIFASAVGLVLLRNAVATSTALGPRAGPNVSFGRQLHLTAEELSLWLLPRGFSEASRLVALGIAAVCLPVLARTIARSTRRRRSSAPLGVFVAMYLVLLEASAATTAIDPIDARLLAVLFVPLLVLSFSLLDRLDERLTPGRAAPVAGAISVLAAAWVLGGGDRGLDYARSVRDGGAGYSNARWRESALARSLRASVSSQGTVYSDAPAAVWATTRLRARCLPPQLVSFCRGLRGDPADLPDLIANRRGVDVAWFSYPGAPARPVLRAGAFALRQMSSEPDGALYRLAPGS